MKKLLLLFLSLLLLTSPCFAQEVAKNKVVVLDDFSGGLATKPSTYSLPRNQGDICENIRLGEEGKSLSKRTKILLYGTADTTESITGLHRLYLKNGTKVLLATHGDEIETGSDTTGVFTTILNLTTGNYRWQWTTWNNIAIGTDGYNQPVKYDGSSISATYLGTCLATNSGAGTGPAAGTYSYKVSFYTTTYEVLFNVASNSIVTDGTDMALSMIPIGPTTYGGETVTGRKIYRLETGVWKLLSNGTIANNTAVTLTDSDTTASGAAYPTVNGTTVFAATPPKGKLCLVHYNRLFLGNDPDSPSRLYFSTDLNPDYFLPTDYYLDIRPNDGDQITFIKTFLGLLTVGKENTIQKVYTDGASPSNDWTISNVFSNIGSKAMYSAQETPIGIIYLGGGGLYKFNGQYSILISDIITPEIKDILESNRPNCWAQYHKNTYYFAYPSKKTGISTNNRILLYDLISSTFTIDINNANCFVTFNSGSDWDVLYYGSSVDGKIYNYTFQAYELVHNKHSDFSGTFTDARYIPTSVGGDANDPVIEIARTATIDALVGTIDALIGTIDRDKLVGFYTSDTLNLGATKYDKAYWNERFKCSSDDITLAVRSAATSALVSSATYSSEFTDPSGSDLSALSASDWTQYRFTLTTDTYIHSPEIYKANNYNLKLTYFKEASASETSIPMHWRNGWLDFLPGYKKTLRKIQIYYSGDIGTVTYKFETSKGDTDSFVVDMNTYPDFYEEYFTGGALTDELFRLDITNNDLNPFIIRKIVIMMDIEPLV